MSAESCGPAGPGVMPIRLLQLLRQPGYEIPRAVEARFDDEGLCRRCGSCCHSAIKVGGRLVLLLDLPCRYLTRAADGRACCRIYARREKTGFCNKLSRESVARDLFPPDCPYVQGIPRYQGKIAVNPEEFQGLRPDLREIFRDYPQPAAVSARHWRRFRREVLGLHDPKR
jgi:hypothetical protein